MSDPNPLAHPHAVPVGEFRRQALLRVLDLLRAFRRRIESRTLAFQPRASVTLLQYADLRGLTQAVADELATLHAPTLAAEAVFPDAAAPNHRARTFAEVAADLARPIQVLTDLTRPTRGGLRALEAYNEILAVESRFAAVPPGRGDDLCRLTADDTHVYFFVTPAGARAAAGADDDEGRAWRATAAAAEFVTSVGKLLQRVRRDDRTPTAAEAALVRAAYEVLGTGTPVGLPYPSLGVPGFKPIQTWLFLTDPGDGHLQVTCHRKDILSRGGAAVHIEHIDRDEEVFVDRKNHQELEQYRLPAPVNVAKVRLHLGPDAPSTAFIGRPVFENHAPAAAPAAADLQAVYQIDRLKAAHMTAAACTAMFQNGVAECKIAIERMTAAHAIDFMKAVVGNVFRDPHRQYLSAAFNIFRPIYDDRGQGPPKLVDDPEKVCALGIALAAAGGFDKVTWDGAHPTVFPSVPILGRWEAPVLDHALWVKTVHAAHEAGLTTYVSAGLEPQHMPRAVYAALDGVGIGVKLHYFDTATRQTGDFNPAVMTAVLDTAAVAQKTALGRAAKMLARLDRMKFEGILGADADARRGELFACLRDDVKLPQVLGRTATDAEKDAHIKELLAIGDTSDAAAKATAILANLEGSLAAKLPDDEPLANPLHRRIMRLEEYQARQHGGLESALSGQETDALLERLRAEVR